MRRRAIALTVLLTAGCGGSRAQVMPGEEFMRYKRAYVEALEKDEYSLYSQVVAELMGLGLEVHGGAPTRPVSTDLLVKYTYRGGWNAGLVHPREFQVTFTDALSGRVVATAGTSAGATWPSHETRVESAFRKLRQQLGYDPDESRRGSAK